MATSAFMLKDDMNKWLIAEGVSLTARQLTDLEAAIPAMIDALSDADKPVREEKPVERISDLKQGTIIAGLTGDGVAYLGIHFDDGTQDIVPASSMRER